MELTNIQRNKFNKKIRNRLFKQFLVSLSLVLIIIGIFLHYSSYSIVKNMVFQRAEVKTQLAYELLNNWVDEDRQAIRGFSHVLSFQNFSLNRIRDFLEYELNSFHIGTPYVAYNNGDVVALDWEKPATYVANQRPWYIGSNKFYSEKKNWNSVYYSKPYVSIGDDKIVFTMTSPVIKDGEIVGYVGMDVDIGEFEKRISSIDDIMGNWFVVSDEGFLLVSGSNTNITGENVFEGPEGRAIESIFDVSNLDDLAVHIYHDGSDNFFLIRDPVTRWVIVFKVNNDIINSQVMLLNYGLLGGALLLLAIFAIIISIVSSKFTLPIVRLAHEAEKIAGGDFDCRVESNLRDELGYLTYRFNFMAQGLKEREEYENSQSRLKIELQAGQDIQMSILPEELLSSDLFSSYAFYSSAREVGGDFYDFFEIDDHCVVFCIGDVSGKGVPAAIFMTMVCTLIRAVCRKATDPAAVLSQVNDTIAAYNTESMFATIFLAYYNPLTGECVYANGGHNPAYILRSDGVTTSLKTDGMLIGGFVGVDFKCGRFRLGHGDSVIMYTDGITEAHSENDELYGESRLESLLIENTSKQTRVLGENIINDVNKFQTCEQFDDMTLLIWKRS